jgi:hypothetical protein
MGMALEKPMTNKIFFTILALSVFLGGYAVSGPVTVLAASSSCIECHTNEQALKTLHKPSKVAASEEGEG